MIRTLVRNPLLQQLADADERALLDKLRSVRNVFAGMVAVGLLLIPASVFLVNVIDGVGVTIIFMTAVIFFTDMLYGFLIMISPFYLIWLGVTSAMTIHKYLNRFDGETLFKLLPQTKTQRLVALLTASQFKHSLMFTVMVTGVVIAPLGLLNGEIVEGSSSELKALIFPYLLASPLSVGVVGVVITSAAASAVRHTDLRSVTVEAFVISIGAVFGFPLIYILVWRQMEPSQAVLLSLCLIVLLFTVSALALRRARRGL